MSAESRQLPNSNITRQTALMRAKMKNDTLGAASFLTTNTKTRLAAIETDYTAKWNAIPPARTLLSAKTAEKTEARRTLYLLCSHFIQVFDMAVLRGYFAASDRAYYNLDVSGGALPPMESDTDLLLVSQNLVTGEAARTLAGGAPMLMPEIAMVQSARNSFITVFNQHSTLTDAYDTALESLDALNPEADKVIKKVWDEVETYYNEEDPASQRENAREWGVVYERKGGEKTISGTVTNSITGAPAAGVEVKFANGLNKVLTPADGSYSLTTTLMDEQTLTATLKDVYQPYEELVTLVEGQNLTVNISIQPK